VAIYHRHGVAVLRQIHGFNVSSAGVAGVHANEIKFGCNVDGELVFVLFPAGWADHAPVLPLGGAERAEQGSLRSVTFTAQNSHDRASIAEWANRFRPL
jgi:hypothetical protein